MLRELLKRALPEELSNRIHRHVQRIGVPYDNIFHCCTWKSASQWFVQLLSHPYVLEYSGMGVLTFGGWFDRLKQQGVLSNAGPNDVRTLLRTKVPAEFAYPRKTIATTLYYSYQEFLNLPLPELYRAFFVIRDPRDLVVSYYFSMRDSHVENARVRDVRQELQHRHKADGLHFVIDQLADEGFYDIPLSWFDENLTDPRVRVFRYEDLATNQREFVEELMRWLGIRIPCAKLEELQQETAFNRVSGRKRGEEDTTSHYRRGVSGDWRNHLCQAHVRHLHSVSDDLTAKLGYESES